MGWSVGFDSNWGRDIGYGVPAWCDQPYCYVEIDRGLSFVCGGEPYGGEDGCGLYFCTAHVGFNLDADTEQQCERCAEGEPPHEPKPDHPRWVQHKLTDPSWEQWRIENPEIVKEMA